MGIQWKIDGKSHRDTDVAHEGDDELACSGGPDGVGVARSSALGGLDDGEVAPAASLQEAAVTDSQ